AAAQLASAWFNPLSFLDPNAPAAASYGGFFWLKVALWEPVLFGLTFVIAGAVLEWLRSGSMPVKLASTAALAAVPVAMLAYYASEKAAPRGVYVAGLLAWAVPVALIARSVPPARWRKLAAFMLGLSAFQLAILAVEYVLVVPSKSMPAFL